jgi:hypothetical protein
MAETTIPNLSDKPDIPDAPAGFDAAEWAEIYTELWGSCDLHAEPFASSAERTAWVAQEAAFLYRVDHPEVVEREADIPAFDTEGEEADYWQTHAPAPDLRRRMDERAATRAQRGQASLTGSRRPTPPKQPAPISLRLEADTLHRMRALAARKGTKYQTLLKQFVQERLYEEEQREGLVPPRH